MRFSFFVSLCLLSTSLAANLLLNVGGPNLDPGFRCDTGKYVANIANTATVSTARPVTATNGWTKSYDTHRVALTGDLVYNLPVPNGQYMVFLFFMETAPGTVAGTRVFNVAIQDTPVVQINNGQSLDVFTAAPGLDKPYFVNAYTHTAVNNNLKITLGRIAGKGDPMISGIAVMGATADALVGNEGLNSCPVATPPPPPPAVTVPIDVCPKATDLFINAGSDTKPSATFRCDVASYASTPSGVYTAKIAAPIGQCTSQYLSHRFATGTSDLTYIIPVQAGTYSVYLQFFEGFFNTSGSRVFSVSVNGAAVPNVPAAGLDVFVAAGGKGKALLIDVPNVSPVAGVITINLGRLTENPMISGIGIVGTGANVAAGNNGLTCGGAAPPSVAPTPPVAAPLPIDYCPGATNDAFFNAGGITTAPAGFRCDPKAFASTASSSYTTKVAAPIGQCTAHYLSHRWATGAADLTYTIPVPAGTYKVALHFMETFFTTAGQRVMTVTVNGVAVPGVPTGGLDVFAAAGGKDKPLLLEVPSVTATNQIVINLGRVVSNPMISGFGIQGVGATANLGQNGLTGCTAASPVVSPVAPSTSVVPPSAQPSPGSASFDICPGSSDVYINAGGENFGIGFRCDTGTYASAGSSTYSSPMNLSLIGGCTEQYTSHRFSTGGQALVYDIPVAPGTYTVYLQFMEIFFTAANQRLFTVKVNGQPIQGLPAQVDVFALAEGKDIPYFVDAGPIVATNKILIELGAVPGKDNPMISGIGIVGIGASQEVGTIGLESCTVLPPAQPGACDNVGSVTTNFTDDFHLAHAVSGGPYVETDFDKDGKATVPLNGIGSHSHESNPAPGQIVEYTWTWNDPSNAAAVNGLVTMKGPTPLPELPLGVTTINLEVRDQFCNRAAEDTTITVNSATKPGAYCYYYDFMKSEPMTVPIPSGIADGPRPQFATNVGDINFGNTASFGTFKFNTNSFAVRCVFKIDVQAPGTISYNVVHNGPVKIYRGVNPIDTKLVGSSNSTATGTVTATTPEFFDVGVHDWQILYFRKENTVGQLKLQSSNGAVVPAAVVRHDAATTLPVITNVAPLQAAAGEFVTISGSAFVNGVVVKFGNAIGEPIVSSAGAIQLRVPEPVGGQLIVDVVIETNAGISNGITFEYPQVVEPCQVVQFTNADLLTSNGLEYIMPDIAVIKYGPDGRLYLGSQKSKIHALTLDKDLKVTKECTKDVSQNGLRRWILGIAFNPKTTALKMFFTSNTFNWKKFNLIPNFAQGWQNGKVQSVTLNGPTSCFNNDVTDVVTGLPVTNHDHGNNALQFLPDGRMLIFIGGFTNGGISVENDLLGGIPPAPLAGAIVTCPTDGSAKITYSNLQNPAVATVTGGGCTFYAIGLRNTFAGEYHTNGNLYVTDNGPNQGFGAFSTDCNGGQVVAKNIPDRLLKVEEGKCHGHPHVPRGLAGDPKQCVFNSPQCVQPLLDNLQSSTNGVLEYRSNLFKGQMKADLLLAKFSDTAEKVGKLTRVKLNEAGTIAANGVTTQFESDSGLSIVEGPRGEIIMSRVFKQSFFVLKPVCPKPALTTFLIGVHPKRGPASGGHKVLITGYNFGTIPTAKFGENACTDVTVIDDDSFTCITPAGIENTQVKVVVVGSAGENVPTTGSDYWYW